MKILDRYLLKSFLTTFTTVFVILFFIFILQTVWLFISELAGKNLDFVSVIKFLTFAMPRVVPLVLPLSVLLASIMTFGSLAENYEFAAMKSSGISLQRAMKYLTGFILLLTLLAFLFANNVIPYAEYKFINFRRNIAQVKPAMAIAEGQFSEIGNYTIKVEKKSGDNGRYLDKVTIHKKSSIGTSNTTIIKAEKGELVSSEKSNVLQLVLKNGNYYEDITPKNIEDHKKLPFAKSEFERYVINIDLSKLNESTVDDEKVTNTNTMLNIGELLYTLDSLNTSYKQNIISYSENFNSRTGLHFNNESLPSINNPSIIIDTTGILQNNVNLNLAPKDKSKSNLENPIKNNNVLLNFNQFDKAIILKQTLSNVESNLFYIDGAKYDFEAKKKQINLHWIAFYDKFVIAFSCLLMFFIGAPLGSIIRKGGLGLPIVFAVGIFIIFHFVNTFGKKLAQEDGITPILGSWLSTFVLLPLAIFLTKRATDDKGASIEFNWLSNIIDYVKEFFKKKNIKTDAVSAKSNDANLKNKMISNDAFSSKKHKIYSTTALVLNIISIALLSFINDITSVIKIIVICLIVVNIVLGLLANKALKIANNNNNNIPNYVILLAGFPFYFIFYIYEWLLTKREALQKNLRK